MLLLTPTASHNGECFGDNNINSIDSKYVSKNNDDYNIDREDLDVF